MSIPTPVQEAIDRLVLYNSNPIGPGNPYGFANYGNVTNFPLALTDVSTVAAWLGTGGGAAVLGPSEALDGRAALFDGVTGKLLKLGPLLAAVASSGAYGDLSGRPTLGSAAAQNTSAFASSAQGELASSSLQPEDIGDSVQGYDAQTAKRNVDSSWSKPQRSITTALTSASSITVSLALSNDFDIAALAHNATIPNPADVSSHIGQKGRISGQQNATGGFTITLGSIFFPIGSSSFPPIPTGANDKFSIHYDVVSATRIDTAICGVGV